MIKIMAIFISIAPIILIGGLVGYGIIRYTDYISEREEKARERRQRLDLIKYNIRRRSSLRMKTGHM